jgi:hypothetical protein
VTVPTNAGPFAVLGLVIAGCLAACGARTDLDVVFAIDAAPRESAAAEAGGPDGAVPGCRGDCQGCCDSAGTCHPGTTDLACGSHGFPCMACADGDICNPGNAPGPFCVNPCSNRCTLRCCLRTGVCQTGIEDDACGNGGSICDDCVEQGMVCGMTGGARLCKSP